MVRQEGVFTTVDGPLFTFTAVAITELAERVRNGSELSQREREYIADQLLSKPICVDFKGAPAWIKADLRDNEIQALVLAHEASGKKLSRKDVAKKYGLTARQVYSILKRKGPLLRHTQKRK
jgi:hypothetical protein